MARVSRKFPLAGWYVISTRPLNQHAGVRRAAGRLGARVFAMSTLRLQPLDAGGTLSEALRCDLVIATSTLILQNLLQMSGNYRNRLIERPLVVLSKRGRDWALAQGFTRVHIAPQHDDAGIVSALIKAATESL